MLCLKVVKLDVRDQKVYMNNGQELEYDKVLIATGVPCLS